MTDDVEKSKALAEAATTADVIHACTDNSEALGIVYGILLTYANNKEAIPSDVAHEIVMGIHRFRHVGDQRGGR